MKIIFSSTKNKHFKSITEYVEYALKKDQDVIFFEDREFIIPGRIRDIFPNLNMADLVRINKKLLSLTKDFKPDLFLEAGGHRILPETVDAIKKIGVKTALWTIDAPGNFDPIIKAAPHYDYIFTGGSEAYEILQNHGVKRLHWLPFACDTTIHKSVDVTESENKLYSNDIAFVGSFYPNRLKVLEEISDFDVGVWGPGWERTPADSPLNKCIRRTEGVGFDEWVKIFSSSKIAIVIHYKDDKIPCFQASPKVYEALACKCFLLVDNQRDVVSLFEDGKHLTLFNDTRDLREKITYYLSNNEERNNIAEQGYLEVSQKHTYTDRVEKIFSTIKSERP